MIEIGRGLVLLLPVWLLSPGIVCAQVLTAHDSAQIGTQIGLYITPYLRPNRGADSTNSVCVKVASNVRGAFFRSFDSSMRAATGGPLVAPLRQIPLRSVEVVGLHRSRDTVFVTVRTASGGLRAGESDSGTEVKVRVVRHGSTWLRSKRFTVMVGDGYVRKDKPVPPAPPKC